jgi:hypothetical protein
MLYPFGKILPSLRLLKKFLRATMLLKAAIPTLEAGVLLPGQLRLMAPILHLPSVSLPAKSKVLPTPVLNMEVSSTTV